MKIMKIPKGTCPKHGKIEILEVTGSDSKGVFTKLNCCARCYMEWVADNVTQIVPDTKK